MWNACTPNPHLGCTATYSLQLLIVIKALSSTHNRNWLQFVEVKVKGGEIGLWSVLTMHTKDKNSRTGVKWTYSLRCRITWERCAQNVQLVFLPVDSSVLGCEKRGGRNPTEDSCGISFQWWATSPVWRVFPHQYKMRGASRGPFGDADERFLKAEEHRVCNSHVGGWGQGGGWSWLECRGQSYTGKCCISTEGKQRWMLPADLMSGWARGTTWEELRGVVPGELTRRDSLENRLT